MKKRITNKKLLIVVGIAFAFFLGLGIVVAGVNYAHRESNQHIEVTFVDPHTALIFWTTTNETIGYVKYGSSEKQRPKSEEQTSSQPGTIHAVVLSDIPVEGVYVSLHNESDPKFLFAQTQLVKFNPETYLE